MLRVSDCEILVDFCWEVVSCPDVLPEEVPAICYHLQQQPLAAAIRPEMLSK